MKHLMLSAVAAFALVACGEAATKTVDVATPQASDMMDKATAAMPVKTKAVLIYADWCGSCKVLDPAVKKVQSMGPVPGVEFVVLDYTAKDADDFYAQAEAAGVASAVQTHFDGTIKTGQMLLVDLDDEAVIGTITKDNAAPQILAKIKTAVSQS